MLYHHIVRIVVPSRKGSPNKITVAVREAVENSFRRVNNGKKPYLEWLAYEHPSAYVTLVSKCIPSAVAIDIKHTLDLSAAMHAASLNADTIDISPDIKEIQQTSEPLPNPLIINETESAIE